MPDNVVNVICDRWLSEIFGYNVYKVVVDDNFIKNGGEEIVKKLMDKPAFLYAKVRVNSLGHVNFLEKLGFRLVDTNITFEKQVLTLHNFTGHCFVRFVEPSDKAQVIDLARRSFEYSRFHLDTLVPNDIAKRIKGEWAGNFFGGKRGDQMVVAVIENRIVGFLQLLFGEDRNLIIDLIAVAEKERRKSIASDMIYYSESKCKGFERVRVGTQVANTASMRLYENCGFRVTDASYIFHYHNGL